ncbi:type II secretion system F family protein [Halopseudomonas salegens]|uniref:Type II secretion system protein F (GspF) n=1 Tax=Halopseudomonas salegens TaxID=1434072 RepID=A0A1H2HWG1_9GAMM|nr:type II secretion system F family protein [Halopseudomonas salegens]SDU36069.1 type II secretion system protein F (GspF) [Halopseudomonas salegens]
MAFFKYQALDQAGKQRQGVTEMANSDRVADWLLREGLVPVRIEAVDGPGKTTAGSSRRGLLSRRRKRQNPRERMLAFTRDLSVMLGSGLPLDKSLQLLEKMAEGDGNDMIRALREDVRKGVGLAEAFANRETFSPFYVSMIRAGEASGTLDQSLRRMAEYLERAKALRQMVMAALTYPAILFGVAVFSLVFLLAWVVPGFADLFSDMGGELPTPTYVVMQAGNFMAAWWWLVLGGMAGLIWLARYLWRQPGFKSALDARVLGWPLVGELVRNIETSRFSRTLGVLLQGGVTMITALAIARETVTNTTLKTELLRAEAALREGRSLSTTLIESERFPVMAMHMIQVGEETGRLEDMLLKVSDIYEDEVGSVIKRLLALLEPALILTLGMLIAGIIISILLGILGVNELIG